jgi:hypothetical protein
VASRGGKLERMEAAERERRDMLQEARLLTPMQRAARQRRDGALETIRAMPPRDPGTGEAGIARAREALARGRQRVSGSDRR